MSDHLKWRFIFGLDMHHQVKGTKGGNWASISALWDRSCPALLASLAARSGSHKLWRVDKLSGNRRSSFGESDFDNMWVPTCIRSFAQTPAHPPLLFVSSKSLHIFDASWTWSAGIGPPCCITCQFMNGEIKRESRPLEFLRIHEWKDVTQAEQLLGFLSCHTQPETPIYIGGKSLGGYHSNQTTSLEYKPEGLWAFTESSSRRRCSLQRGPYTEIVGLWGSESGRLFPDVQESLVDIQ